MLCIALSSPKLFLYFALHDCSLRIFFRPFCFVLFSRWQHFYISLWLRQWATHSVLRSLPPPPTFTGYNKHMWSTAESKKKRKTKKHEDKQALNSNVLEETNRKKQERKKGRIPNTEGLTWSTGCPSATATFEWSGEMASAPLRVSEMKW